MNVHCGPNRSTGTAAQWHVCLRSLASAISPDPNLLAAGETVTQMIDPYGSHAHEGQDRSRVLRRVDATAVAFLTMQPQSRRRDEQQYGKHISEFLHGGSPYIQSWPASGGRGDNSWFSFGAGPASRFG